MRNIWALIALTMVVGCGGEDGKNGSDGAPGQVGAEGPPGADGQDGAPGADGMDGADGKDGSNGSNGTDGMDGAPGADGGAILQGSGAPEAGLGADGDIYIDTVSRDVYQKSNGVWAVITNLSGGPPGPKGDQGEPGADGASVLTGDGAPAAGLGSVGDVYIDSATGNLYTKAAGGWALSGSLKGPAGEDGADGVDLNDTVGGVRWFAFALSAAFVNTPALIDSETHTATSSEAQFAFSGAGQHGRLAFHTSGSFVPGGVDLVAYDFLDISATVTGGDVSGVQLYLVNGDNVGCQWDSTVAAGPSYSFDLSEPTSCYNNSAAASGFTLASVTGVQIGIVSNGAGARTLSVTSIGLVSN